MSKVKLNLALTLDGFIARENGDVDYLPSPDDSNNKNMENFKLFLNDIDTIVMGRSSYEKTISFGEYPFGHLKNYILTRSDVVSNDENIIYTSMDVVSLTKKMLEESSSNVWLFGGGNVVTQFLENNLVDELHLTIIPILLGKGIKLFGDVLSDKLFDLKDTLVDGNFITLVYLKK